jgi:CrcB protein
MAGSLCRYALSLLCAGPWFTLPWGTFASNLAGCFVIGLVSELAAGAPAFPPAMRLLLATGFCGGFTTLSSLIHELFHLARTGDWVSAALYLNGTFFGAMAAFGAGTLVIRMAGRLWGGSP